MPKVEKKPVGDRLCKALAQAEIERAKGVAEANRIIGDSLKGNESYLRYLWISGLKDGRDEGCPGFQVPPRGLQH